jgi:hypothetical protein
MNIIHSSVFILKNVSEIGFCLRLQVEPTQLAPINPYLRTMDNVQKHNSCKKNQIYPGKLQVLPL